MTVEPKRRALRNRGGAITTRGPDDWAARLRAAWEAADADPDILTHGFHAYPARMHPGVARVLVDALTEPGGVVVDPFCGGGTVVVESMVAGRVTYGIDLNPVAVRVAAVRSERRDGAARERFAARLQAVVEASMERVSQRARSRAPVPPGELKFYAPHVLRELGGLYEEIRQVDPPADRKALLVLLSSIIVKFSVQRADTSHRTSPKRIGKKVSTGFFARKGEELIMRWAALDKACADAKRIVRPKLIEGDALELAQLLPRKVRADAIITSPPYGGTYDYADHHARRYPWLGVSPKRLRAGELGARRHMSNNRYASKRWDEEVAKMLASMASVLTPGGLVALVIGDAQLGTRRVDAQRQVSSLAPKAGLRFLASASQSRPDWQGGEPRDEHIVLLRGEIEA